MKNPILIEANLEDISRPANRPPKSNWQIEMLKKSLFALQHVAPKKTAKIIWHYFTKPGRTRYSEAQEQLLKEAVVHKITYQGHQIYAYRWGTSGPKVLLSHGWRSKATDFRRMISALVAQGYVVEGIDMKAHGQSDGSHSALPEFIDILKNYYVKYGPYHTVIGYSLGGLASGMMLSEVTKEIHPAHLILIATPPYARYFFHDIIKELKCKEKIYHQFCELVAERYHQPVDYYDLRHKISWLEAVQLHLIYDEHDQTVRLEKGRELWQFAPEASFVHTKGLGHYKVIAYEGVIEHIIRAISKVEKPMNV